MINYFHKIRPDAISLVKIKSERHVQTELYCTRIWFIRTAVSHSMSGFVTRIAYCLRFRHYRTPPRPRRHPPTLLHRRWFPHQRLPKH